MAKSSGLGDRFFIAGYDLSGDVNALSKVGGGPELIDVTSISSSAYERIGGRRSGGMEFTSHFNDDAARSHVVLAALPTTDVTAIYSRGATVGCYGAGTVAKQIDYGLALAVNGALTANVSLQSNAYGVMFGQMLTAGIRTESAATNGASIDFGSVSTLFGCTAFLVCTALGSGTPTIKLQDSADDATFADITGATFGTVAALDNEIVQTATGLTVRRYVRAVTTGTFASLSFAVLFVRHEVSTI